LDLVEKCNELRRKKQTQGHLSSSSRRIIRDFKPLILRELETLRREELANKNFIKERAYAKVIKGIQPIDYPILIWEDLKNVSGIGKKIESKIKEILREGYLFRAQEIRVHPRTAIIEELMTVHGIGGSKAKELYQAGIRGIKDLEKYPELLNESQRIGLRYYDDFRKRIPREEMDLHARVLKEATANSPFRFEVVGSYRRGANSSGDIDVLLTLPPSVKNPITLFYDLIQSLREGGYLTDTLAEGVKKYMGVAKIPYHPYRRIDLLLTPQIEYPYALVYFTGTKAFNIRLRLAALEKGYSLSEYGLVSKVKRKENDKIFLTERDLIEFLLGKWVQPTDRN
jgi:DNA polymerase beta